jgi:glycosyltransferase involved in cell wall biosynthesis
VPHIVLVQEIQDTNPLYWMPPWSWYARRNVKALHGVLCSSPPGRQHVIHRGVDPERVVVVPPGVDTRTFRPAARRPDRPTAIFVGELRPDKGVMEVIAACDLVAARLGPSFRLIVVGDGSLRAEVEGAAATREWLDYRGHIDRGQVPDALRSASAFVLAPYSRRFSAEQFGFASVEAMACGLPVVTTRAGAIPEVVPSHNPLSAEHDVAGVAEGLCRALASEGEVWGQMNRAYACDRYDLDRQGAELGVELEKLIATVTATDPPPPTSSSLD